MQISDEYLELNDLFSDYCRSGIEMASVEIEIIKLFLPLPIFELGNSLITGWGVVRSRTLAVKLYTIGSRIGDRDCQLALAHTLGTYFGSKKRMKMIAFWLRQASKTGWSTFGDSWIWDRKYDNIGISQDNLLVNDESQDIDTISELIKIYQGNIILSQTHSSCSCLFMANKF